LTANLLRSAHLMKCSILKINI